MQVVESALITEFWVNTGGVKVCRALQFEVFLFNKTKNFLKCAVRKGLYNEHRKHYSKLYIQGLFTNQMLKINKRSTCALKCTCV